MNLQKHYTQFLHIIFLLILLVLSNNCVLFLQHPNLSEPELPRTERKIKNRKSEIGYLKISRHYKWALSQAFEEMNYDYVIVVEGTSTMDNF